MTMRESVSLVFSGDHRVHPVLIAEPAYVTWDDTTLTWTVTFDAASAAAAEHLFWELLRIIPALREDHR